MKKSDKTYSTTVPMDAAVTFFLSKSNESALRERFYRDFADEIDKLYQRFLTQKTLSFIEREEPGFLATPVESFGLSSRASAALRHNGIDTIGDLANFSKDMLAQQPMVGDVVLREITPVIERLTSHFLRR